MENELQKEDCENIEKIVQSALNAEIRRERNNIYCGIGGMIIGTSMLVVAVFSKKIEIPVILGISGSLFAIEGYFMCRNSYKNFQELKDNSDFIKCQAVEGFNIFEYANNKEDYIKNLRALFKNTKT